MKNILLFSITLFVLLGLSACGGDDTPAADATTTTDDTVTALTLPDDMLLIKTEI